MRFSSGLTYTRSSILFCFSFSPKPQHILQFHRNIFFFFFSNCSSIIYVYRRNLAVFFFCIAQNCKQMMPEQQIQHQYMMTISVQNYGKYFLLPYQWHVKFTYNSRQSSMMFLFFINNSQL